MGCGVNKPSGFYKRITINYFKESGEGSITSIITLSKAKKVKGETWKEAIICALGDQYPSSRTGPFTVEMEIFDTTEEWDDYEREFKEYHAADTEDQEYMILSEPDTISWLFMKDEV